MTIEKVYRSCWISWFLKSLTIPMFLLGGDLNAQVEDTRVDSSKYVYDTCVFYKGSTVNLMESYCDSIVKDIHMGSASVAMSWNLGTSNDFYDQVVPYDRIPTPYSESYNCNYRYVGSYEEELLEFSFERLSFVLKPKNEIHDLDTFIYEGLASFSFLASLVEEQDTVQVKQTIIYLQSGVNRVVDWFGSENYFLVQLTLYNIDVLFFQGELGVVKPVSNNSESLIAVIYEDNWNSFSDYFGCLYVSHNVDFHLNVQNDYGKFRKRNSK